MITLDLASTTFCWLQSVAYFVRFSYVTFLESTTAYIGISKKRMKLPEQNFHHYQLLS